MISVGEGTLSKLLSMWIGGSGSYDHKSSHYLRTQCLRIVMTRRSRRFVM
ncbi:hypothetical protein Bca101_075097 [Brassica carinata]